MVGRWYSHQIQQVVSLLYKLNTMIRNRQKKACLLSAFMVFGAMAGYAQSPGGVPVASWWRADAATTVFSDAGTTPSTDSSALYQWNDYTGHGYNFIQAVASLRPVYSNARTMANFNPTVTFNSDYMEYTPSSNTKIIDRENGALYAAGYMNTVSNSGFFGFDATNDFPGLHTYPVSGRHHLLFFTNGGPGYQGLSDSAFQANTYFTSGAWWQNGAGMTASYAKVKVSLNGNRVVYSGNQINNVNTGATYDDMRLGQDNNWGALNGQMNEMMVFEDTLTSEQMDRVETYLALKYGSTYAYGERDYKSATGTVVWAALANAGFHRNIAGIARDNDGALYQKQSWSTNPGQQVLISTTDLANTNAANTGVLSNNQYLVWGDNGLEKSPVVSTDDIAGANFRFASVWKVQNTGSVSTVRVAWPQNTGYQSFKLVQSSDATFATGNTVTDMTANTQVVNGVTYNYADVILTDGQYFTFAVYLPTPGGVSLPAVWYKPDGVTNGGWTDASINGMNLINQSTTGDTVVRAGNQAHNFHNWTTGYSNNNYYNYIDTTISNTNLEENKVFGNYNLDGLSYMPISIFGAARPTASANGLITGMDNELANGAEPALTVYPASGNVSPRFYRFSNGIDKIATTKIGGLNQTSIFYAHPYPGNSTSANGDLVVGLNGMDTVIANQSGRSSVAGPYLKIGYSSFGFGAFQGDIQEVIWYKTSLTDIEKQKVETYLSLKFGTTLAHHYVNAAGDTVFDINNHAGYTHNIAGIGYEPDNGGLNQKQSNSVNAGNQVLVSTTGLAHTNDSNTTSLADGQFLVWGDNGLPKAPSIYTGNTFTTLNVRFAAIWKVQNTASVGLVRVAWPAGLNHLSLIQSTDTIFDASDVVTDMTANTQTINGVVYNYADVVLSDGQYFTFASNIEHAPGGVFEGLSLWYRADKQTSLGTGDSVMSWTDYAMGVTAGQISTNDYPLYQSGAADYLNFNPGINFTTANQSLGNIQHQALSDTAFDIFTLTKEGITAGGAHARIFSILANKSLTAGNIHYWDGVGINYNSSIERYNASSTLWYFANPGNINFASNSPSVMYNTFTNTTVAKGVNGAPNGTAGNNGAYELIDGGFIFGSTVFSGNGSDNYSMKGNIGETIVYGSKNLTAEQRNKVEAYLAIKYGITLDTTSSYLTSQSAVVWDKAADKNFYHNVAGIGRDDVSDLYQKQSRSQITNNVDSQLTIALDTIYENNLANPSSIGDQQFLIWGDNGNTQAMTNAASTYTTFTFNGSSDNRRMNRIWKTRNTGVTHKMTLSFPVASVGSTTLTNEGNNTAYVLIYATDPGFTNLTAISYLSEENGQYVASLRLSDSVSYFTFAKVTDSVSPLSVTLFDFTANKANREVLLQWTTTSEQDNKGFGVERSLDGKQWESLGFVASQAQEGNSPLKLSYTYTDHNPIIGQNFYRLKQIDFSGRYTFSPVRSVVFDKANRIRVYPNPVKNKVTISGLEGANVVTVSNAIGQVVLKQSGITAPAATLSTALLVPGTYVLTIRDEKGNQHSFKMVKR